MLAPRLKGEKDKVMKTAKRITALTLALVMMLAIFIFPAGAADARPTTSYSGVPTPTILSVTSPSTTMISIDWDKEDCDGYEVYMMNSTTGEFSLVQTISNNKRHCYATPSKLGLKPGTAYVFAIYCYDLNSRGVKCYGAPVYVTGSTTPEKVTQLRYNAATKKVTWNGVNCEGYQVEVTYISADGRTVTRINDGRSDSLYGSTNISVYTSFEACYVRVRAVTQQYTGTAYLWENQGRKIVDTTYGAWSPLLTVYDNRG